MITLIYAPPRTGKTALLTCLANSYAFDEERNRKMRESILEKRDAGFSWLSVPTHCVFANYDIKLQKFRYSPRRSYKINPFRLGFANPYVETHFIPPYSAIFITEAQKYFNSRMSLYFPDWISRWYEQHGHFHIDVFLDVQRPMLIDVNIRDLAQFIEVLSLNEVKDRYGRLIKLVWSIRRISDAKLWERYISSGGKDEDTYTSETIEVDYNVFERYNSFSMEPKFYDEHMSDDFDLEHFPELDTSYQGYTDYLSKLEEELPKNFYVKRSNKNE